jgi:DNA-binding IclR family transcriptional regulator
LDAIARRGYATDCGEFNERYRSLAVPVRDDTGAVIAALSCGGFEERWTPRLMEHLRGEMIVLADELSRQLGLLEE